MLGSPRLGHRCLFPNQTCKQHLSRFGELCSADGEQNTEVLPRPPLRRSQRGRWRSHAIRKIGSRASRRPNINNSCPTSMTGKSKHANASRIFCMAKGILDKIYRITEFFGWRVCGGNVADGKNKPLCKSPNQPSTPAVICRHGRARAGIHSLEPLPWPVCFRSCRAWPRHQDRFPNPTLGKKS